MKKADRKQSGQGPWPRQTVKATAYGVTRKLQVLSFQALRPEGRNLPAAQAVRRRFGEWDTECPLAHKLRILRTAIMEDTINAKPATKTDLCQLLDDLENYLNLAA